MTRSLASLNYIGCSDSVSRYQYEFPIQYYFNELKNITQSSSIKKINFTFIYNDTIPSSVDAIIFTTCNEKTTLTTGLYLYDENMSQITDFISSQSMIYLPERGKYDCPYDIPWRTIKTSSLIPNKPYYLVMEVSRTRTLPNEFVQLTVLCPCDCNYNIIKNNIIYDNIIIDEIINIEMDINIRSLCVSTEICTILQVGNSELECLPKLSINGTNNNFIIQFTNNYQINTFNCNKSIDIDNQYHNIQISINNNQLIFKYDYFIVLNVTKPNYFTHSNYQKNMFHKLYLSNDWDNPMINSTVYRININSTASNLYHIVNSSNFILVLKQLNWNDAQLFCENQFDLSLAIIHNNMELVEIINLRNNMGINIKQSDLWIALNDQHIDGKWVWGTDENDICDLYQSKNCKDDEHWDYRRAIIGDVSCGYLVGGVDNTNIAFSNTHCENVVNYFLCDRRNQNTEQQSFGNIFTDRTELWCDYYIENVIKTYNSKIFDIRLGTEMKISFDIKFNSTNVCQIDKCNIFEIGREMYVELQNRFEVIASLNIIRDLNGKQYLQLQTVNGNDIEYIEINFDMNLLQNNEYNRMDLLLNKTNQVFRFNGQTYFFRFTELIYDSYIANSQIYSFFMSNIMNVSVSKLCIHSNMIRNNSIWYSLGTIEEHGSSHLFYPSVFSYKDIKIYPLFYYKNYTILIFDDYMWYKYIDYDNLYEILKQKQTYPYYKETLDDIDQPNVFSCSATQQCHFEAINNPSAQQWTQDESMAYWIRSNSKGISKLYVTRIDIDVTVGNDESMDVTGRPIYKLLARNNVYIIPNVSKHYAADTCITTNHTHIFLINQGIIVINVSLLVDMYEVLEYNSNMSLFDYGFEILSKDGNVLDIKYMTTLIDNNVFNLSNVACSISANKDIIYIFGGRENKSNPTDTVYKYNISNNIITLVSGVKLSNPIYNLRAITANNNNKIYLYGGISVNNNTHKQIFDIQTEMFDIIKIEDGIYPFTTAIFNNDHKVIIRYNANSLQFEYFIPELTSIDLSNIVTNVWRYQELDLKYTFWDYNYYTDQYDIFWDFGADTLHGQMRVDDNSCKWRVLSIYQIEHSLYTDCNDPNREKMTSNEAGYRSNYININSTITMIPLSQYLTLTFLKCTIYYHIYPSTIVVGNNTNHSISITAQPQSICNTNPIAVGYLLQPEFGSEKTRQNYTAYISNPIAGLNHYIFVHVSGEWTALSNTVFCTICDENNNCTDCTTGINLHFTDKIYNQTSFLFQINATNYYTKDKYFHLKQDLNVIQSIEEIKLKFLPPRIEIIKFHPNIFQQWFKYYWWVLLIIFSIVIIIIVIGLRICWKQRKLTQQLKLHQQKLKNPLVLFIGVAQYMNEAKNPGTNLQCNNLEGIGRDYQNIKLLCAMFKYNIYPKDEKYNWTQIQIIEFCENRAKYFSDNRKTDINSNGYDSLLLIHSGHGYKNSIISSDMQLITKVAIHRIFSVNYPEVRNIPRLYIFDCCSGNMERGRSIKREHNESTTDVMMELGKNYSVSNIEITQSDDEIWKRDQLNPDYKLSIVHGANDGFQSKLHAIRGSYLIYEFVKRMVENRENHQDKFLGDIIAEIQDFLHDKGKQQIISVLSNHAALIKFIPNDNVFTIQDDDDQKLCVNQTVEMMKVKQNIENPEYVWSDNESNIFLESDKLLFEKNQMI